MINKIFDYYHTLKHVTPTQFYYRVKYSLSPVKSLAKKRFESGDIQPVKLLPCPSQKKIITETDDFFKVNILNLSVEYSGEIDWSDQRYGILWNYHLQYADFLHQDDLPLQTRKELILNLYEWLYTGRLTPESYPASLRCMNTIRFLCSGHQQKTITDPKIINGLYSELHFLENRLEYHLMGNHLMEDAFALLMGGTFFNHSGWIQLSERILHEQISEQILEDGAHYERSPMYHTIVLYRFLEVVYYLPEHSNLYPVFQSTAKKMLSWLNNMSFGNGDMAHFNDSTDQQTCTKAEILKLAEVCEIRQIPDIELSDSGYRRFENDSVELLINASGIAPSYQPGHAHADSLSFILHIHGKPFIVDPQTSTYDEEERRNWERSTKAHNTVTLNKQNTADVWGRFRVGRRPEVLIQDETQSELSVRLYHKLKSGENFVHRRNIIVSNLFIEIRDTVSPDEPVEGRLYFHSGIKIKELTDNKATFTNGVTVIFKNVLGISKFTYELSEAFNLRKKSKGIEYRFKKDASFKIVVPQV